MAEKLEIKKIIQREDRMKIDYGKKSGIKPVVIYLSKKKRNLPEILDILSKMYDVKKQNAEEKTN